MNPPCFLSLKRGVARAIRSFPNGSAGGSNGLRPQHLKDLTEPLAGNAGKSLLTALFLPSLVIQGKVPTSFFGANLIALEKKDWGGGGAIRPIAVGCTLRCLVADNKVTNNM